MDVCVILVKTGIQSRKIADFVSFAPSENYWIPACAGMTREGTGMTREGTGMTREGTGMTGEGAGMTGEARE